MTEQTEVQTMAEAESGTEGREYGFTLMVGKDGVIKMTPHNLQNDFEFVGLAAYVNAKKDDVLKTLGLSLEARALQGVGLLAQALSGMFQGQAKADEKVG